MPAREPAIGKIPFRPVFDAAVNAMLLVDGEPRLVAANGAAARLLRYPAGTLDGRALAEFADGHTDAFAAAWREFVAMGSGALEVHTADGVSMELALQITGEVADGIHLVLVETAQRPASQPPLTGRQADTLRLLCDGATNQQIAAALGISESTVQKHIASIKERLGALTRAQIVAIAMQHQDLALRVGLERLYVHQAIRTEAGEICDTRLIYISHETRRQQPEIAAHIGRPMGGWYPDYEASDLLAILVEAIETGEMQSSDRVVLRPPVAAGRLRGRRRRGAARPRPGGVHHEHAAEPLGATPPATPSGRSAPSGAGSRTARRAPARSGPGATAHRAGGRRRGSPPPR